MLHLFGYQNIEIKEVQKIANYFELKVEVAMMWGLLVSNVKVIPVVIGALGSLRALL